MPYSPYNWDKIGVDVSKVRGGKTFCPKCHHTRKDKRDTSLSVNLTTGLYKCHYAPCDFKGCVADKPQYEKKKDYVKPIPRVQNVSDKTVSYFHKRGISNNTLLRMKITESKERFGAEEKPSICFNYYRDEVLVNIKFRSNEKDFKLCGNAQLIPYNIDATKGETELIWVEGEMDLLSCIEIGVYNVVSVPNGANGVSSKLEYIDNCWEDIEHIERHIIAVDDDNAGKLLKDALSFRFGLDHCFFVKYPKDEVVPDKGQLRPCKDFNEVLVYFGADKIKEIISQAEQPKITGVYYAADVAEEIFDIYANGRKVGETTHYQDLDKIFRWKRRDINLIIGHGNYGKTQMWIHLMLVKSMYDGWRWAIFCPENYPATDFYIDVIEMYIGKHIDNRMGNKMSVDELNEGIQFFESHFIYVYPDEAHDLNTIHEIFRSLILRHGIDGFLLDPWNQLDHIIDSREDLYLSKALKEIKRFALLNDVSYNIIAHPKTMQPNKDNELPEVQVWHISGGVMWNNKCDQIISVERPQWYVDKTSGHTRLKTHKIKRRRTGGSLGDCDFGYVLKESRYCEKSTDKIICDRERVKEYKEHQKIDEDYINPALDENNEDLPF